MSKSSRARKKVAKQNAKAARKALYASYAASGKKKKAKQTKSQVFGSSFGKGSHLTNDCGNPGCNRCYPRKAKPPSS